MIFALKIDFVNNVYLFVHYLEFVDSNVENFLERKSYTKEYRLGMSLSNEIIRLGI
jgi:hypothetical protein